MKQTKLLQAVLLLLSITCAPKAMAGITGSDSDTLRTDVKQQTVELTKERQSRRAAPASTFEASFGVGMITSNLYSETGEKYGSKAGAEWKLAYDYVFRNGLGFGVLYSGFSASYPNADLKLSYLAPAFVGRMKVQNWIFKYDAGVGLFIYDDGNVNLSRVGFHFGAGAEYMLSRHIGIGLSLNDVIGTMPKFEGQKEDEWGGIVRINLLAGLRIYL